MCEYQRKMFKKKKKTLKGRLKIFFDDYIKNYNRYSSKKYYLLFILINYLIYLNLFFISVDVLKENRKYKLSWQKKMIWINIFRMFRRRRSRFLSRLRAKIAGQNELSPIASAERTRMIDKDYYIPRRLFRSHLLDRNALMEFNRLRTKTGTKRSVDRFICRPLFSRRDARERASERFIITRGKRSLDTCFSLSSGDAH